MKRVKIFGFILLGIFVLIMALTLLGRDSEGEERFVKVERRYFEVSIEGKGEILAANSTNIYPPALFFDRSLNIYELKIDNLVKEGTRVRKGDFVAELDHSLVESKMTELTESIEREQADLEIALLDSSVTLAGVRTEIQKVKDDLEDATIRVEQSIYESPAVQRQAKISQNRILRQLENAKRDYQRRKIFEENNIDRIKNRIAEQDKILSKLNQFNSELKIYAPAEGIVMYARRRRNKVKAGDMISPWNNSMIATLPELDKLLSEVYINEIEITKIAVGQSVKVSVDAVSETGFEGVVKEISSIGKESNEDDFKVYRVLVEILNPNDELKPAMSSLNLFVLDTISNALTIPLNVVFGEEKRNFVYLKSGMHVVKQEIQLGTPGKMDVVVLKGLDEGDRILLREPEDLQGIKKVYLKEVQN